jgi:8-oxo-dGTP pyrophosphatase MutT (NUDIX family)
VKILVTGDRNWKDRDAIRIAFERFKPTLVVEGESAGADRLAREVAEEMGIPVEPHPADWPRFGEMAGPIRNGEMIATNPEIVLAFHDSLNESRGTADCVRKAQAVVVATGLKIWHYFHSTGDACEEDEGPLVAVEITHDPLV